MLIPFDYIVKKYGKPNGILHVGANVGEEAEAYDKAGCTDVVWIEPNPEIYRTLVKNVERYNHRHFNICAGDENKETVLHISNNAGQSSSLLDLGTHKKAHPEVHYTHDIKVPMMRLDSFFLRLPQQNERYNISGTNFLNCDVQGFELNVIKGMGDMLYQFKYAYLEVNKQELYKGCALIGEIDDYLKGFGFKRVETKWAGNTGWGDALYIKR